MNHEILNCTLKLLDSLSLEQLTYSQRNELSQVKTWFEENARHFLTEREQFFFDRRIAEKAGLSHESYYLMTYDIDGQYGAKYALEDIEELVAQCNPHGSALKMQNHNFVVTDVIPF